MAPTVPIEFAGQKESKRCSISQIMGKSRKYSKGYATGFVPDFRHAVETMGESEGFGSSGRVDTELTASEDSCAPKRKCLSLNVDGYDSMGMGVPLQVLSLSKMSHSERRELKLRLKLELEQVRKLQKKVASIKTDVLALSPTSDIRSGTDVQKRPSLESHHKSLEASIQHGKKRPPPGRSGPKTKRSNSGSGPKTKRSNSGRFEPVKPVAPVASSNAMLMKQCEGLLKRLMSHQFGWVFNTPVDVVKLNIPDYFTVIKHPMDLGTVRGKIASGEYSSPLDFAADVRLTFSNAMTYNPPGNDVHIMAETLSKYFEMRWKPIEKKIPALDSDLAEPSKPAESVETEISDQIPPLRKKKMTPNDTTVKVDPTVKLDPVKSSMTDEEKHKLSMELEELLGELPESIVDFLKEHSYSAGQTNDDEVEIDIDALSDDTLFKLRKLLDDHILEKQKVQASVGPTEIELLNESGFSNSSMQPFKGNDPVEEDVDIVGGDDPPVSSYPPVEILKDGTNRNSKCGSSSSSSSESGSSSSDSDSGSSSGSDSDTAKPSEPLNATKENVGSGSSLDQKKEDLGSLEVGKASASANDVGQVEQSLQSKPTVEPESCLVGETESAPSDRQVSPDKLYRAALLRSRFADTILKAREKALEKGEKLDPEKLKIEREELERRQKEEKARLQAEAKAAEEARRKAEAAAAAEARRKRELEREAAREALQKMEKTVEINESSQFLEDLEMLRAVNDEHLPTFTEDASPDQFQDGLGSFKLPGSSNPLERLGLYMKVDDEEEEEEQPPQSAPEPGPVNDVEEGEID